MVKAVDWMCPACSQKSEIIAENDVAFGFHGDKIMREEGLEYRRWKCNECDVEIAEDDLPDEIRVVLVSIRDAIERRLARWQQIQSGEWVLDIEDPLWQEQHSVVEKV